MYPHWNSISVLVYYEWLIYWYRTIMSYRRMNAFEAEDGNLIDARCWIICIWKWQILPSLSSWWYYSIALVLTVCHAYPSAVLSCCYCSVINYLIGRSWRTKLSRTNPLLGFGLGTPLPDLLYPHAMHLPSSSKLL